MANAFDEFKAVPKSDFDEFREAPKPNQVLKFGKNTGSQAHFESLPLPMQDRMLAAAEAYNLKTGKQLQINSSFRSADDQKRLYDETVAAGRPGIGPNGQQVAPPGKSKHGTGYAVDIQQGIDDPEARAILQQFGFQHGGKSDAMHFNFDIKSAYPQALAQPGAAPKPATPQAVPQAQPQMPPPESMLDRTLAGISGFGQGATAGLIKYPQAAALNVGRVLTGAPMMPYSEALQQVEQGQGQLQQQYPYTYGAGELGGGLAGFAAGTSALQAGKLGAKAAGAITAPTIVGGVQGATTQATKPESTLGDVAIAGGLGSAFGGAGGALAKGINYAGRQYGETTLTNTLSNLLEQDTAASRKAIKSVLDEPYKIAKAKAMEQKPVYEAPASEGKRAIVFLKEEKAAKADYNKKLAAWEKSNEDILGGINNFASRYVENPALMTKYIKGASAESTTPYAMAMKEAPGKARSMQRGYELSNLGQYLIPSGLGGLGGAGIGSAAGFDPYLSAMAGAGGLAAARMGAVNYALSPGMQSLTQVALPTAAYGTPAAIGLGAPKLADYINSRQRR
jgi:hypothetical protein